MAELPEYKNLIGGEYRAAASGKCLDSINPSTGEVWARIPASDRTDVEAAVKAASDAFPAWSALPAAGRAHYLRKVGDIFRQHSEELTRLELLGIGCQARKSNVPSPAGGLAFLWDRAAGLTLDAVTGRSVPLDANTLGITRREPYGVVAAIVPYNSPQGMASSKASLAIAAGNTVVLKPPEQASPAILRFGELLAEVLPPGVVNMVSGRGADVGDPLVRHPDVRKITMTGAPDTARAIQRAAADNLTSCIFELGGKSPNIVFADADLDKAAYGVTTQAIYTTNAGQACVGGSRILIQRSILAEMLKRMKAIAEQIKLGDPFDPETTMGPLISQAQFDKVTGYIEIGKREAELVFGGRYGPELVPSRPGGFWVEPTLFIAKDNTPRICQEEIFGPVAAVIPFDTEEEAIAIANDSRFGLAAGLWTTNLARVNRFIRDIRSGNVWVNTYLQTRYELPFGGIKDSGYGHDDIMEFTVEKTAVIST
ncbi:aldehyde dehydrogenase (acceptor) [Sphingomonas sp. YR710]|uniref:aldehyde dehydrogenase family protein n=1 Tax=Sphingomonas sp. YR710 TaxID=1882773 RepID=UPI00088FCCA0|nr:aldehyde dehydrogenase family protein [Sphingomonas sp. YR710]SDC51528.1 aldehyde dehydrogenase (acceptor) [Sphingomonas sp. YR710]